MTNILYLMEKDIDGVAFAAPALSQELIAYGEPEAAAMMLAMSPETHSKISQLAGRLLENDITIDQAICLAAVEIFEGSSRTLRRKRRVYPKNT